MHKGNVSLKNIEKNYPDNYRKVFEDMATHMFMVRLNLVDPPIRRKDQWGIESDPVIVHRKVDDGNGEELRRYVYAYQAKYLSSKIEIKDRKEKYKKCIRDTGNPSVTGGLKVTDLFFYVNKELTQNKRTGEKPGIEEELQNEADKHGIQLHWFTTDRINTLLEHEEYRYIREMYLSDKDEHDIAGFYRNNCKIMTDDLQTDLYGKWSLLDSYIELSLCDRMGRGQWSDYAQRHIGHNQSVREYIESWVCGGDYLTIICGEPGHGKTSLCRKAMYDFFKTGWPGHNIKNVFCLSINPNGTKVFSTEKVDAIDSLLSWEDENGDREDKNHKLSRSDCHNALIFLDGFDELLECIPGFSIKKFLEKVSVFQDKFPIIERPHIVITTRSMAISDPHDRKFYSLKNRIIPIKELCFLTESQQYEWISRYVNQLRKTEFCVVSSQKYAIDDGTNKTCFKNKEAKLNIKEYESYLGEYQRMYKGLGPDDELKNILGIPIILRMIVAARYVPKGGIHPTIIYDDLFDLTLDRHNVVHDKTFDKEYIKRKLSRHALKVYTDNGDSAETEDNVGEEGSSWIYSFYTKNKNKNNTGLLSKTTRVGFLHKTFYEYFLAYEILSWLRLCMDNGNLYFGRTDILELKDMLSVLGKQKLSNEVLLSIKNLYEMMQRDEEYRINSAVFEIVYQILKKTDGILNLPDSDCIKPYVFRDNNIDEKRHNEAIEIEINEIKCFFRDISILFEKSKISPLIRGENVFWNVASICSVCSHPIGRDNVSNYVMRYYDLTDCILSKSDLQETNLEGARLDRAHLEGAKFIGADISRASLKGTFLLGAYFDDAIIEGTRFEGARLEWARLSKAKIMNACLEGALIDFGRYKQGDNEEVLPIVWRVLIQHEDKILLITDRLIECKPYNNKAEDSTWERCTLQKWLNTSFFENAFDVDERSRIFPVQNKNLSNRLSDVKGGGVTSDKVFILSVDEADQYFRTASDKTAMVTPYVFQALGFQATRKTAHNMMAGKWWLRTPGYYPDHASLVIYEEGIIEGGYHVNNTSVCVRPALWLQL